LWCTSCLPSASWRRPPHAFPTRRSSDLVPSGVTADGSVRCTRNPARSGDLHGRDEGNARAALLPGLGTQGPWGGRPAPQGPCVRSEEHTSELQSRFELVCRLLLDKKKTD